MKNQSRFAWTIIPLISVFWSVNASAVTVGPGIAVGAPGDKADKSVGLVGDGPDLDDAIKYYIPLNGPEQQAWEQNNQNYRGVYGVAGTSPCPMGAGTCSDYGSGTGYGTVLNPQADALQMNIFFDLSAVPESDTAAFTFLFDDLDLTPDNDPDDFFESLSLSYWESTAPGTDPGDFNLVTIAGPMTDEGDLPASLEIVDNPNLITWELNLAALDALNTSQANAGGFWIQLGFGSDFSNHKGWNTPEYLTVSLELTPVPVPAAFWLFGTALIGFIGFSRRRTI